MRRSAFFTEVNMSFLIHDTSKIYQRKRFLVAPYSSILTSEKGQQRASNSSDRTETRPITHLHQGTRVRTVHFHWRIC